jgi:eight-cysteine-cluster-containing protein
MHALKIIGLLVLAGVLVILGMIVYGLAPKMQASVPQPIITNFQECAAAGNPVMESYPEQCRTADGRLFVNDVPDQTFPAQEEGITANGCAVAGCSMQLCVSADEAATIVTTCEYRPEYACYREASCEPQADGQCGWTETAELRQCLANPPAIEGGLEVM